MVSQITGNVVQHLFRLTTKETLNDPLWNSTRALMQDAFRCQGADDYKSTELEFRYVAPHLKPYHIQYDNEWWGTYCQVTEDNRTLFYWACLWKILDLYSWEMIMTYQIWNLISTILYLTVSNLIHLRPQQNHCRDFSGSELKTVFARLYCSANNCIIYS